MAGTVQHIHKAGTARHIARADSGTLLATTHEVGGGLHVRLRLTRPSDAALVRAFLEGLGPETRLKRFLAATEVTHELVRHFTFYDARERLVLAATTPREGRESMLGIADGAFPAGIPAELGVVVDDEHQGLGIGTLLLEAVAAVAAQHDAKWLRADMLRDNFRMLHLMQRLGTTVRTVDMSTMAAYTKLTQRDRRAA